ncbi:MAG TPA: tetratricopeptide repeat protein [Candidatus Omnitrophota bacterium]|nr:tetratricopeptide repeat protein [Candidatus Omnitrophota bacterium]
MKKILILMIVILAGLFIALEFISSSHEYDAEKLFYRAMKINKKIAINPDVAPPMMVSSVEKILKDILKKYPDTEVAKSTDLALAEFYIQNKKFDEALSIIESVLKSKKSNKGMLSSAQFMKGALYEKQGKWERALQEYIKLRDNYKDTPIGLQIPVYIARHYSEKGQDEAKKAYEDAAKYYEKLANEYKGKPLGYEATNMIVSIYFGLKEYDKAGDAIEKAVEIYPLQLTLSRYAPSMEFVFAKQLKRPERVIQFYNAAMKKAEDPKLKKALQDRIDELGKKDK